MKVRLLLTCVSQEIILKFFFSKQLLVAYKDFMVTVGTLLGAKDRAKVEKEMTEVLEFEKNLAKIYEPKVKLRNSENIYNKMTIADLQQMAPSVRQKEHECIRKDQPFDYLRLWGHDFEEVFFFTCNFLVDHIT